MNQCTGKVESEQGYKVIKIQYLLLLTTVYTEAKQIMIQENPYIPNSDNSNSSITNSN